MNLDSAMPGAVKLAPGLSTQQGRIDIDGQRLKNLAVRISRQDKPKLSIAVSVRQEEVVIPTYLPAAPDLNPMFLERRVYQGSSGKVYPLPFTDRIAVTKTDRRWRAVWIENQYLRVMILPEIGGRIHLAHDKTNGYDFIYRQTVIKPALVGLAGPWISGGIEFNWPQHHRPATFLPADFEIEEHDDGSKTVWLSDHDPLSRMKGMHGVCLHPDSAVMEIKVRVCNRTPLPQTFLWWANVAVRVHEAYQSFFPPDCHYVADHAKRATCEYPLCQRSYYGVNYGSRERHGVPENERPSNFIPPHPGGKTPVDYRPNDLTWYANIPTPCSYMCMGTKEDFFGGYDHARDAGIVHVADHHIAPGKKQWTWGNHQFGYAWDRHLTDSDGPYIELMAGVYTDNQPDFSFLQPGETRAWSQYWYPIQKIGPAHKANTDAAARLDIGKKRFRIGVCVTREFARATIRLERAGGRPAAEWECDLAPGKPFLLDSPQARRPWKTGETALRVFDGGRREIISFAPQLPVKTKVPPPASEPRAPRDLASADELYLAGVHLEQYRHATRCPTLYWMEALRRDPRDSRCHNALGLWRLRRGEFAAAEAHLRSALARQTERNPNPRDGEAAYNLGLCLRCQLEAGRDTFEEAYAAFSKAAWNQACVSAACHALAEMDCTSRQWAKALEHLDNSLRFNAENTRARNLKVIVLRQLGAGGEAEALLEQTLALDPLDWWARLLAGRPMQCNLQTALDLAHDCARAGLYEEAIALLTGQPPLRGDLPDQSWGALPLVHYTLGWLHEKAGRPQAADVCYETASQMPPDYCFPARLEEIAILKAALRHTPNDARALYYLGNLFYDRRRHKEAIRLWERSAKLNPSYSVVWRNLGIARFNVARQPERACAAYQRAVGAAPDDARLVYERDQLWKRVGRPPTLRLRELERRPDLTARRDDLAVELCALYNQTGQHEKALAILSRRRFQPWEGGEGQVLGQYVRTLLCLGRRAMAGGDFAAARSRFAAALRAPENLGEARHPLANQSDIHYWLGEACHALKDTPGARMHWRAAATFRGDFQEMSVRAFSEMTFFSALAWERLGQKKRARASLTELREWARRLRRAPAKIDYFATSLPTMLLFEEDLQFRQETTAKFIEAQALLGLGKMTKGRRCLLHVLSRDPNHALALDFSTYEQHQNS